jgi:hypothetical protein
MAKKYGFAGNVPQFASAVPAHWAHHNIPPDVIQLYQDKPFSEEFYGKWHDGYYCALGVANLPDFYKRTLELVQECRNELHLRPGPEPSDARDWYFQTKISPLGALAKALSEAKTVTRGKPRNKPRVAPVESKKNLVQTCELPGDVLRTAVLLAHFGPEIVSLSGNGQLNPDLSHATLEECQRRQTLVTAARVEVLLKVFPKDLANLIQEYCTHTTYEVLTLFHNDTYEVFEPYERDDAPAAEEEAKSDLELSRSIQFFATPSSLPVPSLEELCSDFGDVPSCKVGARI